MDKALILAEIRKTAEANGGKALGVRRFHAETGIRDSHWQKYWPRYSDAVREAGFIPNELDKQGYGKAELLNYYAKLALELGRLPTGNDLLFKDFNDSNFPSRKTFDGIGSKSEIVKQLISHYESRPEFEPVIVMCKAYLSEKQDKQPIVETKPDEGQDGYVYLAKSGKFFKIGKTNAPGRRDYELAIQLPEKLVMVHRLRTDDPEGIEAYWHRRFSKKRQNGEWFSLTAADVAAFKRRRLFM